jgi:hypothetical protein
LIRDPNDAITVITGYNEEGQKKYPYTSYGLKSTGRVSQARRGQLWAYVTVMVSYASKE